VHISPLAPEYPALQMQLSKTLLSGGACELSGQALQVLSPLPENVSAAQDRQLSTESEISVPEKNPAPHAEHSMRFDSGLKNPAVQA